MEHTLPPDVDRALRRLLKALQSAPAEIKALGKRTDGNNDEAVRASELDRISHWLYTDWYTAPEDIEEPPRLVAGRNHLASALRASVAAATRWETGWVVMRSTPSGVCVVGREGQTRTLHPGQYANLARKGMPVVPGDHVTASELVEWIDQPTGYWCMRSWHGEPQGLLNRLYFSVGADQVGYVLLEVTKTLDSLKLRYTLKCPSVASAYSRVDSLVVYLEAESWPAVAPAIETLAQRAQDHLRDSIPPLTKKIGRGVAFAESPDSNQSFGESRCRALAYGVLAMLQNGQPALENGPGRLIESLEASGINPARPWQNTIQHAQK